MAKAVVAAVVKKVAAGAVVAAVGAVGVVASTSQPASPLKGVVTSVSGGQPTAVNGTYVPPSIARPPVVVPVIAQPPVVVPVIAKPPVVVPVKSTGASVTGQVVSVSGGQPTGAVSVQAAPPAQTAVGQCGTSSSTAVYIPPSQAAIAAAQSEAQKIALQTAQAEAAKANAPGVYWGGGAVAVSGSTTTAVSATSCVPPSGSAPGQPASATGTIPKTPPTTNNRPPEYSAQAGMSM